MVLQGIMVGKEVARTLSRIYAFDLFVHNTDRHLNNYLCVGGRLPGHTIKAYDFSRAFIAHGWPLPRLPMSASEHTIQTYRHLRAIHAFNLGEAMELLKKLKMLPVNGFKDLLESLPTGWIDAKVMKRILKWWAEERAARIEKIAGGLKDGSFL